jgi:hypothetical protein
VTAVAWEGYDSLALKSDGTVWAWGYNAYGQLGNGTYTNSNTPVRVPELSNIVAISGGFLHAVALKSDGTVWAWGYNYTGQLGNGTFEYTVNPPAQVSLALTSEIDSLWNNSAVPGTVDAGPGGAVELGVKFTSSVNGTISGIRFYKSSMNTGTHIGNLWSIGGGLLASATFTGETPSGWQTVTFSSPVPITANTVYVASYHTDVSHFSFDANYFATAGVYNPPLQFLASGVSGGNGVYTYSSASTFPSSTYEAANYWVDVVFAPTTTYPLESIAVTPNNSTSPTVNVGASQQFTAIGTYQDNSTQDISTQVTWSSTNPAAATIIGSGLTTGQGIGSTTISAALVGITSNNVTLNVQAAPPASCPCTIWNSTVVPTVIDAGAGGAVELGVKFTSSVNGMISGIRFYKSSMNTGTHIGNLWSSTGTNLATATFTNETGSGWQQVNFSSPVAITAGTTYVASYHTNVSHFSVDLNAFATVGVDNPPLHALATGVSGGDGSTCTTARAHSRPTLITPQTTGWTWCSYRHHHRFRHAHARSGAVVRSPRSSMPGREKRWNWE